MRYLHLALHLIENYAAVSLLLFTCAVLCFFVLCCAHQVLGRAIINVVAGEGKERVERQEPLDQFQQRMVAVGFELRPISNSVLNTALALIQTYASAWAQTVHIIC